MINALQKQSCVNRKASRKRLFANSVALAICFFGTCLSHAQEIQRVNITKSVVYVQTNASTTILNPRPPGPDYGGPFGFAADVVGEALSSISPPGLVLAAGSGFNSPAEFNGYLAYNSDSEQWAFGNVHADNYAATSQAEIDSLFANGLYRLTVMGKTLNLNLTGNAFPNTPVATLSGGAWSNGRYVLDPRTAFSVRTSAFSGYGSHADDAIVIQVSGATTLMSLHSTAPGSNWLSRTVPPNTFPSGTTSIVAMAFIVMVSKDTTTLPDTNSLCFAGYSKWTVVEVVTLPEVTLKPADNNTVEVTFTGILQESEDLETWSDVTPQPTSPWQCSMSGGNRFFRAKTN